MISKRVSDISCDSDHINKAAHDYNTTLKKSGFIVSLKIWNTHQANWNKKIERGK